MRSAFVLAFLIASTTTARALPMSLAQSGYLLDAQDQPGDGARELVFSLYDTSTLGTGG